MDDDSSPNFAGFSDDEGNDINNDDDERTQIGDAEDGNEIKKRSKWWAYFDEIFDENGDHWAKCKHCDGDET